jgi:hypothetical protein
VRRARTAAVLVAFALCAAAVAGATADLGAASAPVSGSQVRLATEDVEAELQVRPRVVNYTGDGTAYVGGRATSPRNLDRAGIHWISWKRRRAFGRGFAWLDDCRPDCARGNFHPFRATIRASHPRHGLFGRLTIVVRRHGRRLSEHRVLHFFPPLDGAPGYYAWG